MKFLLCNLANSIVYKEKQLCKAPRLASGFDWILMGGLPAVWATAALAGRTASSELGSLSQFGSYRIWRES
jgi:hypothetical protein